MLAVTFSNVLYCSALSTRRKATVGWGGGGMVYLSQASHSLLQSQEMLMYPKSNIHMESPTYRDFKKSPPG